MILYWNGDCKTVSSNWVTKPGGINVSLSFSFVATAFQFLSAFPAGCPSPNSNGQLTRSISAPCIQRLETMAPPCSSALVLPCLLVIAMTALQSAVVFADTVTAKRPLSGSQSPLVSKRRKFALGFFQPGTATFYVLFLALIVCVIRKECSKEKN